MQLQPGPEETLDALVGPWRVFQLRRGHRFSTDDLACAWRASLAAPQARRVLDLGCGVGSVGLSTLYRLPADATLVAVEAQEVSAGLARRTVALNGLSDRVRVVHGDLRDATVLDGVAEPGSFELVTGSPPYKPLGTGVVSPVPQRAGARMELRGSVYDYCRAAARWLAPGGRFCFVMIADDPRTEDAPIQAGLRVIERWDYVFAAGRAPLIATLVCAREGEAEGPRVGGQLVVRGDDGEWTDAYQAFRDEMSGGIAQTGRAGRS